MRRAGRDGDGFPGADLTPLVDVVFLLIVFFILVAQLTSSEREPMNLARLDETSLESPPIRDRAVINVVPGAGYKLGPTMHPFDESGVEAIQRELAAATAHHPDLRVTLRAPRDAEYADVHRVLLAIQNAGAPTTHLVAEGTGDGS